MVKTPGWHREPRATVWLMTAWIGLWMWLRAHRLADQTGMPFGETLDAAAQEAILLMLAVMAIGWGAFVALTALARRRTRRQTARQHQAEGA